MTWLIRIVCLILPLSAIAHSGPEKNNCSIERYGTHCEIRAKLFPSKNYQRIVYCGDSHVYVDKRSQAILNRYLDTDVNMVLKVDGETITGPCF